MRAFLLSIGLCLVCSCRMRGGESPASPVDPDAAVARLQAGNKRFVENTSSPSKLANSRRLATAQAQHPFAIVVGCSDSRTPPELIFDQNMGDLFVVRTAGNLADDFALGSIEYAVEHLGARLIVVLGHSRCGAVAAAMERASAPGHVGAIVRDIRPAVEAVQAEGGDRLVNAIKSNIDRVAKKISAKAELGSLISSVRVVEAYYDLDNGEVTWLKDRTTSR